MVLELIMNISANIISGVQNTTLGPTSTSSSSAQVVSIMNYIDITVRVLSLLTHLGYVLITITHKELRFRSLLFMHNANFIGLVSSIMFAAWINTTVPSIADPFWYRFVCSIAEASWVIIKYSRAYSILVLGVFRFIAVFYINLYKKLAQSVWFMAFGCLVPWLLAALVFLIAKFSAHTTYAPILCSDGYTTILRDSILYYLLTTSLGYLLPIIFVILLFIAVNQRLVQVSKKLNKKKPAVHPPTQSHPLESSRVTKQLPVIAKNRPGEMAEDTSVHHQKSIASTAGNAEIKVKKRENRRERTLAFQFMTLNTLELISAIALTCININLFVPNFNTTYYYMRQLFRIVSNLAQSLIPVISIVFHPFKINRFLNSK